MPEFNINPYVIEFLLLGALVHCMKNMASHKRIKLPPLKVTHHSQKEAREVYRGHKDADMETLGRAASSEYS